LIVRVLRSEHTTVFLVGLLLTTYLVLRAIYTPMLHDEIATFFYFIQPNDFLPPNAHWDANNHVLNSFLGNLSFQIFGDAPWALRLPNVLLYPIYILFSWKIVSHIPSKLIKWCLFLALISSTYLFEYFALSRGYGMSMGFLIMGLYLFTANLERQSYWAYVLSLFVIFIGVSANLTLIYIFLMLFGLALINLWLAAAKNISIKIIRVSSFFLYGAILSFPAVYFSLELKSRGALYYGGNSFVHFTLKPLTRLIFANDSWMTTLLIVVVFLVMCFCLIGLILKRLNNKFLTNNLYVLLLAGSVAAIFINHYILGVNFPEDRTAMFLIPLFFLSFGNFLSQIRNRFIGLLALPLLFVPIKFISDINVKNALFAPEERHIQAYYDYINEVSANQKFKPTIGSYATQSFCWYYMNYRDSGEQNATLYSSYPDTICDYQIVNEVVSLDAGFLKRYKKLNTKPINKQNLYQRKAALTQITLSQKDSITNWNHSTDEYFNFIEIDVSSEWQGKAILIEIEGIIHAPHKPFYASLTVSQKDENWDEISQERTFIGWQRYDWSNNQKSFTQRIILPNINPEAKHVQFFLWNIKKQPLLVKQCKVTAYLLY
jgi:hypothetical protein